MGVGGLPGMCRGFIVWNDVSDYCLERGVGLLLESRRGIVVRNRIIALCPSKTLLKTIENPLKARGK